MLYFVDGNIFESPAQTLVNTVNTVGAMGKGIAYDFKRYFPEMFVKYQRLCESGALDIGKLWIYQTNHKWVLNFPTKKHWRQPSKPEYIESGLKTFVAIYDKARIASVAFPQLGCGNGELDWKEVKPMMTSYLKRLPIDMFVYEFNRPILPEHRDIRGMREWLISEPGTYPFEDFQRDLVEIIDSHTDFLDLVGNKCVVTHDESHTTFREGDDTTTVPWRGDEFGGGWLELWQLIRHKSICTTTDMSNMGLPRPGLIVSMLTLLPYFSRFPLLGADSPPAIRLCVPRESLPLFSKREFGGKSIRI